MRIRRPRPRSDASAAGRGAPPGPVRRLAMHQVEPAIDAAVDACRRHDIRRLAACVSLLAASSPARAGATGPSGSTQARGPVGRGGSEVDSAVDLALGRRLLSAVGDAWAAGWQPADLARVVSRERGRRHARLAVEAIVRDAALYPPAAVPRRWREQVDELAAAHKAGRAGAEEAWAVRPVGEDDRVGGVRLAIEVVALVQGVPPVPKLGRAPGEPGAGETDGEVDSRMLQRVRGLLAKAESTTFPEEAEALTAKAQELMARYAIDAAWVAAERGRAPEVGGRRVGVDDPYAGAKAMLLEAIASANRCRSVWTKSFGYATVFGDEADLEAVELLYTSLLVQAARAMLAPPPGRAGGRSTAAAEAGRTRSFRQSFLVSFAVRIGDRLAEAVESATAAAADASSVRRDALLPVLAGQRAAAEAACEAAFPEVKATTISARDWAGWHAGKQAAEAAQLDLHAPVPATRRHQLGG